MDMIKIRLAKEEDVGEIVALCEAHAWYEESTYNREGKAKSLKEYLFG
ncbi:MAG: hypothetical protein ACI94Y_002188 [Maribacter sp.]|jgi:hypothetical protein